MRMTGRKQLIASIADEKDGLDMLFEFRAGRYTANFTAMESATSTLES